MTETRARIVPLDPSAPDPAALAEAGALLRSGGLVAFPTETVYGLGANALDPAAVAGIYEAKGRPGFNPLIVHVASVAAARQLVTDWPDAAERLASAFWPGPLTLVLPKQASIPDNVTAGLAAVGLRIPAHPVALALLREAGVPLAAPSANRFTELSPTSAEHVLRGLGDRIDLILDGGPSSVGIESTVLDLSGPRPVLLRPGGISREQIEAVIGPVDAPAAPATAEAPRRSPGQIERHYAPRLPLHLASTVELAGLGERAAQFAVLVWSGVPCPGAVIVTLPGEPAGYARGLYAALHQLDDSGRRAILVEDVPMAVAWESIRDRLRRAAHPAPSA